MHNTSLSNNANIITLQVGCVWNRSAHAGAAAALCEQHGLPEDHNVPAQHTINMQDAATLTGRQHVKRNNA